MVSSFPVEIGSEPDGTAAGAGVAILGADYGTPANGIINITVAIQSGGAAAALQATLDGATYLSLNAGSDLKAGALYAFSIPCKKSDSVNFAFSVATTIGILEAFFVPSQ